MHVWGGNAWNSLVCIALEAMGELEGKSVLELGFNDGSMAREFARRGAQVTALEVREVNVEPHPGVTFIHYDGNLDTIQGAYDFVFTKSVLVLTDIERTIPAICRHLKPNGRAVFIENGAGAAGLSWLRYLLRPKSVWGNVRYLGKRDVRFIASHFEGCDVHRTYFPPVYLMVAHRPIFFAPEHRACASR